MGRRYRRAADNDRPARAAPRRREVHHAHQTLEVIAARALAHAVATISTPSTGLAMIRAFIQAVVRYNQSNVFRPQILVLMKPEPTNLTLRHPKLLTIVEQLKAGQGLTIACSVLPGSYFRRKEDAQLLKEASRSCCRVPGFRYCLKMCSPQAYC